MKKILALSLILCVMVAGCSSPKEAENTKTEQQEVYGVDKVEDEAPKVVEEAEKKRIQVTLNSEARTKEDKWDELEEGYELVVLDVTLENDTDKEYEFNPNYVQLIVDGSTVLETDKLPKDKEGLGSKAIEPGGSVVGIIVFEIEEGKEYKVIYDDFDIRIELD